MVAAGTRHSVWLTLCWENNPAYIWDNRLWWKSDTYFCVYPHVGTGYMLVSELLYSKCFVETGFTQLFPCSGPQVVSVCDINCLVAPVQLSGCCHTCRAITQMSGPVLLYIARVSLHYASRFPSHVAFIMIAGWTLLTSPAAPVAGADGQAMSGKEMTSWHFW